MTTTRAIQLEGTETRHLLGRQHQEDSKSSSRACHPQGELQEDANGNGDGDNDDDDCVRATQLHGTSHIQEDGEDGGTPSRQLQRRLQCRNFNVSLMVISTAVLTGTATATSCTR